MTKSYICSMKRFRLTIIAMLLGCLVAGASQPHHFYARFTSWEGLPEAYLSSVCQDGIGRLWVGSKEGVYYYTGEEFVPFTNPDYLAGCALTTTAVMKDSHGCIWIVSPRGTGYYDIYTDSFTLMEDQGVQFNDVDLTPDGRIWLTSSQGIYSYSEQSGNLSRVVEGNSFSPFRSCVSSDGNIAFTARNNSIYLLETSSGNVKAIRTDRDSAEFQFIEYVGESKVLASNGLHEVCLVDLETGHTESIIDSKIILNKAEVQCFLHHDGLYWIGTTYGLLIYDPVSDSLEIQFPDELNIATLGAESVRCLFSDRDGNVWAGTWNGGLRGWMTYEEGFIRFVSDDDAPHTLFGNTIRAVSDGADGNIWIGSEEGLLCRFNPENQSFDDFTASAGIAFGTAITDITRIGPLLWITTYGDGITSFDPVKGKAVRKYSLQSNDCMTVMQTSDGEIFAGTMRGLYHLNKAKDAFEIVDIVGTPFVHWITEDKQKHLLLSTYFQGLGIYDLATSSYKKVQEGSDLVINNFLIDSRGILWAATDGAGLCRIDIPSEGGSVTVRSIDKNSGMPSNTASSITEDGKGHLWVATTAGLVEFDPVNETILKTYMQRDNVIGKHFTYGSNYQTPEGQVYLGTNDGLLMFDPEYVKERFGHSPIYITDITLGSAGSYTVVSQIGRSAINSESIRVKQKDAAIISLTYSSMNYANPNVESYECYLTKSAFVNHIITDESHISYTNLRPGSYRFTVNFENSQDDSTAAGLDIVIVAPWYRSSLALLLYILSLALIAYWIWWSRSKKKEEEATRRLELGEAKKEKDLAHEKMDFFTNIAHEIRTPVSVLQILLDKTQTERKFPEGMKEDMKSMRLNVERLKKLCDDLLDFRKMDSGQAHMVFAPEDICAIVRKSINSFESAAKARNLDVNVEYSKDAIISSCDADAIESVVCNLLSNAIKYSNSLIDCKVTQEAGNIVIRVSNDGIRLPDEESELIFEPFYQSKTIEKNGTGLGLTYSRKIASLHNGKLFFDTSVKELNSFVLEIPETNPQALRAQESSPAVSNPEDDFQDLPGQKATVLVVEDNDMMRNLIRDSLSSDYEILTAEDGEEALNIVKSSRVDLVVSDIMMPKMDGCELCNAIKEDISLSHIPVLLLTAAVGVETHIRSLKSGADAYIEKPFKMDILKANISNLFRNRDIRNEQFSSSPLSHYTFTGVSKVELDFMNSLHSYILDHISESDLNLDRLADAMSVSRATLTRKVKADTGMTVNEYVRICRLKKAVELLAENNYRINEVAYLVGFSSPSYFTLSFQKQFGKLPSEFTKEKKQ